MPLPLNGGVEFESLGQLPGRQGLKKDTIEWDYGKCRIQSLWSLTNTRAKTQDVSAYASSVLTIFF